MFEEVPQNMEFPEDTIIARYNAIAGGKNEFVRNAILENPILKNDVLIDYVGFTKPQCHHCSELTQLYHAYNDCGCPHCIRMMQKKEFDFIEAYYEEYFDEYTISIRGCKHCLNLALAEFGEDLQNENTPRDEDYSRSKKNQRYHYKNTETKSKLKKTNRIKKYRDIVVV